MTIEAQKQCPGVHTTLLDPAPRECSNWRTSRFAPGGFSTMIWSSVAQAVGLPDASYDRYMVAFGIRNFRDLEGGLRELHRVLKPGGQGVILEFTPWFARY